MSSPAPQTSPPERFESDAALAEYLALKGLEHVTQLGASVLSEFVFERDRPAVRYVLSRQRLLDFATAEALRRHAFAFAHAPRLLDALPGAALQFLESESAQVALARGQVARRLVPPAEAETRAVFEPVLALRRRHPSGLIPRPDALLRAPRLEPLEALPGFRWRNDRPSVGAATGIPTFPVVELRIAAAQAHAGCSTCPGLCEHSLAAVDATLLWLQEPMTPSRQVLLGELRKPAWERALAAMDRALTESDDARGASRVSWRIHVDRWDALWVEPWLQRLTRKGTWSPGARVAPQRLMSDAPHLSPADQRLVSLATEGRAAERPFLLALVGHPHVSLLEDPSAQVHVERAKIGLLADHRGDSVVVVPALDGAPIPPGREELSFLYDGLARRLTVLELPEEVRRTLEALGRHGNDFPPESHAALVETLSSLSARVPVAMPRTVLGEAVAPQNHPVLRMELQPDGSVRAELRLRPLPESATFVPGEGARDVHVRRAGKPFHARRELGAERSAAMAVMVRLPFLPADRLTASAEEPFVATFGDPQRALAFLTDLEACPGPKVDLEWLGPAVRLAGRAEANALKVTLERRRDWFGASGGLSVEGERISLAVLLDAARRKERFVRIDTERYVEVAAALRRHLERLVDHVYVARQGLELGPSAVDVLHALGNEGAKVDADATWQRLSARIFASADLRPRVPKALKASLRDYQREGFNWMARLAAWGAGCVLADDMGLGKTMQALALLLDRARLGPALVVAPTSVGFNWVDEARRFAPSLKLRVFAEEPDRGAALEGLGARDVLILSYGLLARDATRLAQVPFATVVLDEAQALKNAATRRARAARELKGEFKVALSGTPLENHLGELWSLYRTVFPGLLGSWDAFRDRFATPIEKHIDPTAGPALSRVLAPFLLRRTKSQVARELPLRTELRVPVVLSPEEWQLYEDARLAALSELETPAPKLKEQQRRVQVLAALTRLRLLSSHPRLYDPTSAVESSKLKRLLELLSELGAEGHRALVFSQFTSHLALVREVLDRRSMRYLYLDGRTPRGERARVVQAFQEGAAPLFLVSLKAGGVGLNLTAADNVIHLDPWWNPAVEDQASDRAHRIGQHRPVTIYRLISKGTIEEQILALHRDKRALVESVLDGTDRAARLSSADLLSLLSAPAARRLDGDAESATRH